MKPLTFVLPVAALVLGLAACQKSETKDAAADRARTPPVAVARGVIDAEPGLIAINAPFDGVVRAVNAREGEQVSAGAVLAQMDDRLARLTRDASDASIAEIEARVAAAQTQAAGADAEAARLRRLADADAGTRQDADTARRAAQTARDELVSAQKSAEAARARRRLDAYAVDARSVTAPVAGRILRRPAAQGSSVVAGAPLFVLEPHGTRIVRAELDEVFVERLRVGMTANVSLEADPAKSFPARVERIGEIFGAPALASDPTGPTDTRSLTIILSVPADQAGLRLGQRVLVRINP